MSFKIPIKKSRTYTEFYGLKIEQETKRKMQELDKLTDTDVTDLARNAIREAVDKAHSMKISDEAS